MRNLVLVSGGVDSTVALIAAKKNADIDEVAGLFINYGQQARRREYHAAKDVCRLEKVGGRGAEFHEIDISAAYGAVAAGTPLLTGNGIPDVAADSADARAVFAPARNTVLLSWAIAFAAGQGFDVVTYAPHAGDAANFMDCRPDFVHGMAQVAAMNGILLNAPTLHMQKSEVVRWGHEMSIPWSLTWSCYRSGPVHCGHCPACRERIAGFEDAEVLDALLFVDRPARPSAAEMREVTR